MVKKILKIKEIYCVLIIALSFILGQLVTPVVSNVTVEESPGIIESNLKFPITNKVPANAIFKVDFDVKSPTSYGLRIVPDDCAEQVFINGEELNEVKKLDNRCNYTKGFVLSKELLKNHKNPKNHFTVYVKNTGGSSGLGLYFVEPSFAKMALQMVMALAFGLMCFFIAKRLNLGWISFVILAAVIVRGVFFAGTSEKDFAYDLDGHVSYVEYIIEHKALPGVDDCWSCYHPPVYYVTSVPFYKSAEFFGVSGEQGLRFYGLLLSMLVLFFGILFLKQFFSEEQSKALLGISVVLWAFWPTLILVTPRIGNDILFYTFHVICMWAGLSYVKEGRGKFLIIATIATALSLWTKGTGIITFGMFLLFACGGYLKNYRLLYPSFTEKISGLLIFALLLFLVVEKIAGNSALVDNSSGLNTRLRVGAECFNFLYFDIKSFITEPYTSAWSNGLGREYFWNYAFKTALFGEFKILPTVIGRTLATFISVSFLGLLGYGIYGFWKTKIQLKHWLILAQGLAFFGALMYLRYKYPYACSNDFRYIVPVVLSVIPFVAYGISYSKNSLKAKFLGYGLVALFVLSTIVLYILAV